MAASSSSVAGVRAAEGPSFLDKLNTKWHKKALIGFMVIVLMHWVEHIAQAIQVYALGWPRPKAGGFLGLFYPWLVQTETLHYGYALVMLIGLWILRRGFTGVSRKWWMVAFWIQFWHHFEHLLLQYQAITHHYFFGQPVPTSIVQLVIPRVELHLLYNTIVFIPMVIGMYYHLYPPEGEAHAACTCAIEQHALPASA